MKYTLFLFALFLSCINIDAQTAEQQSFYRAKIQLEAMLNNAEPLSYEQAIFTIENAWYNNQVSKDDFDSAISFHLQNIKEIVNNNYNLNAITEKPSLLRSKEEIETQYKQALTNWAIYTYMTEKLYFVDSNNINYHSPYLYSYTDPKGSLDWANTQVIHLNNTLTGNCFALASLFKIFADRLHTDAKLCTAPNHIYISHADEKGTKYNIELGSKNNFPGTGEISAITYTTNQAIQHNIAQKELTLGEAVALTLVYLAKGYEHKFNAPDDGFILDCAETALQYEPKNLNALLLKTEYLEDKLTAQKKAVKELQTEKDFRTYQTLITTLYDLGYREMPMEMKNTLIKTYSKEKIEIDTTKLIQQLTTRYATVSWGVFDERHTDKIIERYGNTEFNTKTKKITAFVQDKPLYNGYDFDPVVFALNVDPMAKSFPYASPYLFAQNSPIAMIDREGKHGEIVIDKGVQEPGKTQIYNVTAKTVFLYSREGLNAANEEIFSNLSGQLDGTLGAKKMTGSVDGQSYEVRFKSSFSGYSNSGEVSKVAKYNPVFNILTLENGKGTHATNRTLNYDPNFANKSTTAGHEVTHIWGEEGDFNSLHDDYLSGYGLGRNFQNQEAQEIISPAIQLAKNEKGQNVTIRVFADQNANFKYEVGKTTYIVYYAETCSYGPSVTVNSVNQKPPASAPPQAPPAAK